MFQPKHATLHPTQLPPGPLLGRSFEGKTSHVRSDRAPVVCGVWACHRYLSSEWSKPAVSMCTENVNGWLG